jgi:hypothetical protein
MLTFTLEAIRKMKPEEIQAALLAAQAANQGKITLRVSAKGALSVYGLQQFPVTLYREQWVRLLDKADEIKGFIMAHSAAQPDVESDVKGKDGKTVKAMVKTYLVGKAG